MRTRYAKHVQVDLVIGWYIYIYINPSTEYMYDHMRVFSGSKCDRGGTVLIMCTQCTHPSTG